VLKVVKILSDSNRDNGPPDHQADEMVDHCFFLSSLPPQLLIIRASRSDPSGFAPFFNNRHFRPMPWGSGKRRSRTLTYFNVHSL